MNRFQQYAENQPEAARGLYRSIVDGWDDETLAHANHLAGKLAAAGCSAPEGWVISEISEDFPQSASFALMKTIWNRTIENSVENDFWLTDGESKAILSKINGCLSPEEKRKVYIEISKSVVFGVLNILDENCPDFDLPCWSLVEAGEDGEPTGRSIGGIHSSVFDPEFSDSNT